MAFVRKMTLTVLLCLATHIGYVQGAQCTTEEGCREHLSCQTGGTVYCCPGGERLVVNGTSGVCNCNETGISGLSCSGEASIGQGSQFLTSKPGNQDCTSGTTCSNGNSCTVGSTNYCCPGGFVTAASSGGKLTSCSCRYDRTGYSCTSSSSVISASALTCAMASFVLLAGIMAYT
ncbi:hypothetical protein V1264_019060 [Littorina saxatilis]|uniref:Uncharacterized protein n=1 Tax=Littorina saxatilis TaxID=31220 RepID=A0AAN9BDY5_9CAEN